MKWSNAHLFTLKESPADAEIPSHKLMIRAGLIKKVAPGIFTYGFLALRSIRKFEQIIREEFEKDHLTEVLMPMVHPAELWKETDRWTTMGDGIARFKNRNGHEFCLGPTHEEVITDYIRHDIQSYKHMPRTLFQIQTKFRDEIRPRFGLMRGREFIMKDAYSFDVSQQDAHKSYDVMYAAYRRVFDRLGVTYRVVDADSGDMGGDKSQEFHVLADCGEDGLMVSTESDFAANLEVCPALNVSEADSNGGTPDIEKFATPGLKTIDDLAKSLGVHSSQLVKTLFFKMQKEDSESPVCIAVCVRGDCEVNPIKLKNALGVSHLPEMVSDAEVFSIAGAHPGSCGPVGLDIPVYFDNSVKTLDSLVVGANEEGFHLRNVSLKRDCPNSRYADIRFAKEGDPSPDGKGVLKMVRGVEVGHIFYLGTKYSKSMNATFLDTNGKSQLIEMGCYGIGVSRTVQAAIEQMHDEDGIQWSMALAPFHVHICHLDPKDDQANAVVDGLYAELQQAGYDVFVDDRNERPGVKFKDADLLGFPLRLTVGGRGIKNGEIETYQRVRREKGSISLDNAAQTILEILRGLN